MMMPTFWLCLCLKALVRPEVKGITRIWGISWGDTQGNAHIIVMPLFEGLRPKVNDVIIIKGVIWNDTQSDAHCKRVKVWPLNITIFKEVRPREQGQHLNTKKKKLLSLDYFTTTT
jgi:hypothetical protein